MKKFLYCFLMLFITTTFIGCSSQGQIDKTKLQVNNEGKEFSKSDAQKLPEFELLDLNGKKISSKSYKGKIVVINFFNTWNADSIKEIKEFGQIPKSYKDKSVEVIYISSGDKIEDVRKYVQDNPITLNNILIDADKKISKVYGVETVPTTYIVDKEGHVVARYAKPITLEEIKIIIDTL